MYYCCENHVELAIDIVVDEEEVAPVLEKIDEETSLSTTCNFCTVKAKYKISG